MIDESCLTACLMALLQQNNRDPVAQHSIADTVSVHSPVLPCNMPYLSVMANPLEKKSQFVIVFRSSS